jgi:predicted aldo/keto reductase-like oxidoreductase
MRDCFPQPVNLSTEFPGAPMLYRFFPNMAHVKISILGFGCMRLPIVNHDLGRIDEESATHLLHAAIDAGVNYIDTAWAYHEEQSEPFVGRALKGGLRDRVHIATKLPVWLVESGSDWERFLDRQLKKLDTRQIDFYLMHSIGGESWELIGRLNGMKAMERAKADGRIGHIGFSFHGSPGEFKTIVDGFDWEFCQIQFNFLDEHFQAGLEGMQYAAARGIGVVVMEPMRGGVLAKAPRPVQEIWDRSGRAWSPAEWALRWVCGHPEPVTVLSGMNRMEQLRENLNAVCIPTVLTAQDLGLVEEVRSFYHTRMRVPCTTCGYCLPCPGGVSIPNTLSLYNDAAMFESNHAPAFVYDRFFVKAGAGADRCTECGECEPKCPQGIAIIENLKEAHKILISS